MKKMQFNARTFRLILIAGLVALIAVGAAGFFFAQKTLKDYAMETRLLNSQAAASDDNISALDRLKTYLSSHGSDRDKAAQVVAESKQYQYQDEVIKDLTTYANESGVGIASLSFSSGQTTTGTPAATQAPATTPAAGIPSGVTPTTITVTMSNPINYDGLLRFIRRVEQNITKMQIADMTFSRSYENGQSVLSVSSLNIEVYLRK